MSDTSSDTELDELIEYLVRSSRLTHGEARRLLGDVLNFLNELPDEFVRRRHFAMQARGLANSEIFERLSTEVRQRRFRAPEFSERQLRRMIYG